MRQRRAIAIPLASALCLVLTGGLLASPAAGGERGHPPQKPGLLTVNDDTAALNVEGPPVFGWLPRDRDPGEVQTAYQLKVTDPGDGTVLWDSGRVDSAEQSYVPYQGAGLAPGEDYRWTVRTWDRTGQRSPWADPATFETGIGDAGWEGAQWIRRDTGEADDYTLARTRIEVGASPVVRARAYTAANHTYELFLNGARADRGASFGYPGEGYYQAADVTDLVDSGQPLAIGIRYHWYGGGQGRPAAQRGLLHKLVIEHADGTRRVVGTDGDWRVTRDTRFVADAPRRNGEGDRVDQQDARGIIDGWSLPAFDDSGWQGANALGAHPTEAFPHLIGQETRLTETEVPAVELLTADDGTVVADFGKVIPARPQVRFDEGVAGRAIPLRTGYELTGDGRVATSTLATQGTNMDFPYTQADGPQDYRAFTHLGFRYLEIPGAGEGIALDDVSAVVVHTAVPAGRQAAFRSSDHTLNEVWDMMQRSALYSVQEQFVDTPTREKGQFLGDAAAISYATMQGFAERDATQQAIREFLASQQRFWSAGDSAGRYNAVYPNGDGKRDIPDYTEIFVDWVWRYYQVTGDRGLLAEAYPAIRATADYVLRHIPESGPTAGLVTDLAGGSGPYRYGIVDWPAPGRFGYDMDTAARTTINALGVEVLRRTADMAQVLDRPDAEAAPYRQAEAALTDTMNAKLRAGDGTYVDGLRGDGTQSEHRGQHSTSYAIAFGVAPERDYPRLAEHLAGMGMRQGPMTAHWLLRALSEADRPEAVLDLLTDRDDLGWANILDQGATFTWEAWTLDPGTNFSQSHGWGAQAAVDVVETLLGIRPGTAGGATVTVHPPATGLDHARGTVHTQRGPVALDWVRTPHGLRARLDVPVNATAHVELPVADGTDYRAVGRTDAKRTGTEGDRVLFEVGSGTTTFVPVPAAGR
ncbi:family 78 glycoside hydrolase catalytic domain [Qaidamihabitans albus]|uniref:family 78 glycoside hydrolase catalytic domain n=1 Tax=Qaidamihabitans albus TaxID=2795733 RepID=UPI0018F20DC2|nr:family 78 glycoside hydrolase catalytic domain [Qaidamihabitans albus]